MSGISNHIDLIRCFQQLYICISAVEGPWANINGCHAQSYLAEKAFAFENGGCWTCYQNHTEEYTDLYGEVPCVLLRS